MSTPKINLQIITPEKIAYKDKADQITLPTGDGEITIMANHIPLISTMKHGELIIKNNGKEIPMAICNGFVEVRRNCIIIMTDIAERVEEIDEQLAKEAKKKAQDLLKEKDRMSDVAFADATALLEKSLARIRVARRKRR
ncbi:MAG: ATP synthase F1 subunit epsilon, partial [Patescibacteria group bacterium]|nr:ATP synthase F1 subunit epsilon [Patescibacteria group bacterium]